MESNYRKKILRFIYKHKCLIVLNPKNLIYISPTDRDEFIVWCSSVRVIHIKYIYLISS